MKVTSYNQAVEYLESFIGKIIFKVDKKFVREHDPLQRMRVFLSLLGNPQNKFRSILVGGTSGKGSTAYLISHILTTAGYKTGLTISPHLQKVNERLQIDNKEISDLEFTKMLNSIVKTIELMEKKETGAPSYFEILVGMAFKYFADQKVDLAVVEVGMGGEFDATNTLNPLISVLTNVGLDHTNVLGKTVEKIARTKAGIIKSPGVLSKVIPPASARLAVRAVSTPVKQASSASSEASAPSSFATPLVVVSGVKQPSVIKIIQKKCEDKGSRLNLLWRDFGYKIKKISHEGSVFDLIFPNGRWEKLNDLRVSLLGDYQVENASLAIEVVLQLRKFGFEVSEKAIRNALKTAFFPGRFEIIRARGPAPTFPPASAPSTSAQVRAVGIPSSRVTPRYYSLSAKRHTLILDGAHNPTKMKAFLTNLEKIFPNEKKVFIIGFKFDKDIKKMLKQIVKVADEIIVTEFKAKTDTNLHGSTDAESIKYQVLSSKYKGKISVEKDSAKALKMSIKTIEQFSNSTIIVVTGSLYLVGEIRNKL